MHIVSSMLVANMSDYSKPNGNLLATSLNNIDNAPQQIKSY